MKYQIESALKYIRRSPYQALAAISIISLTFFVATFLALLAYISHATISYLETQPQVIAFLKDEATGQEISQIQSRLQNDPRVKNLRYVSKEEALSIYKETTKDNPLLSELVSPEIFPASLEFSLTDLKFASDIVKELKNESIVKQVNFTASIGDQVSPEDVVQRLQKLSSDIRLGGVIILAVLLSVSFLILLVIIGVRVSLRKDEIEILKLIGATPGFIRAPLLIEVLFYCLSGMFIGWLAASIMILYAAPNINAFFDGIKVIPQTTIDLIVSLLYLLGGELILAVILAALGSFAAISRYLRS